MARYEIIRVEQLVEPPLPIREAMDEEKLFELRDSIRSIGIIQPLVVTPVRRGPATEYPDTPEGHAQAALDAQVRFEIIAGHRRYMAARLAPLVDLPCMVYDDPHVAKEAFLLAENLFREDVTPIEEALFFEQLIEKYDCTEDALCRMVRQSPDYVDSRRRLLAYDPLLIDAMRERKLPLATAKELQRCPDEKHRHYLLGIALDAGLTAKVARSMVHQFANRPAQPDPAAAGSESSFTYAPTPDNTLKCEVCGGDKDPQNLKSIYVHHWELEGFKRLIQARSDLVGAR
jgi:ParB family chromosome partitioning protein